MSRTTRETWIDKCTYVKVGMPYRWVTQSPYAAWPDLLDGDGTHYSGWTGTDYVGLQFAGSSPHLPENNPWDWLRRCALIFDPRTDYAGGDYNGMPPDAVVVAARLKVWVNSKTSWGTNPTFNVYSFAPNTPANIVAADYVNFGSTPFCNAAVDYGELVVGARNNFELNAAGRYYLAWDDYINLGIRIANFDVGGIEHEYPDSGSHYQGCGPVLSCASYTDRKALLEIDYESSPMVGTRDAEDVDIHTARFKGRLMLDGGLACQGRFEYGETLSFGEVTDWQTVTEENPSINQGYFYADVSGLKAGTTYYYRAVVANSMGTDYGWGGSAYRSFTTLPAAAKTRSFGEVIS
jgi:hypothetical protein